MIFKLNETEIKLLLSLKDGFLQILIYKTGAYPSRVSFVLKNGKRVTLGAKGEKIAPRFEVFPMTVSEEMVNSYPEKVIELKIEYQPHNVTILRKSEWDVALGKEEKSQLLGDPCGSTTQYEGQSAEIPDTALNQATFYAGVEVKDAGGRSFLVATSMFPYALYVSDCDFSETVDLSVYEYIKL